MSVSTFSFPTTIHFGAGARRRLAPRLQAWGVDRPLVVTDGGVARLPLFAELTEHLEAGGHRVAAYAGVLGNPVTTHVTEAATVFEDHDADCVIGVGGGAALDVAKAVLVAHTQPGELLEYEDVAGAEPIEGPLPAFFAVPTTAGTGSEVGRSAVIADDAHVKHIIFSPGLLAREVFSDPELTVGLPAGITAATGMDALSHNVEAYLARRYHPICDGIAVEGVRLCAAHLARAVQDGTDLDARAGMLMASMMGAIAFQKGLGVVHSCAHALGTVADLHHGLANGLMIDHALAFNRTVSGDKLAHLAVAIGLDDPTPAGFLAWVRDLKAAVGVPDRLARHGGVGRGDLDRLVDLAVDDVCHANNPRPVTASDFRAIFVEALG